MHEPDLYLNKYKTNAEPTEFPSLTIDNAEHLTNRRGGEAMAIMVLLTIKNKTNKPLGERKNKLYRPAIKDGNKNEYLILG